MGGPWSAFTLIRSVRAVSAARDAYFGHESLRLRVFPGTKDSILLDMATSEVAWGKVAATPREKGQPIPESWAVDAEGKKCSDPHKARLALPPSGGAQRLTASAVMVGSLDRPDDRRGVRTRISKKMYGDLDSYRNLSSFILVIDPAVFGSAGWVT